MPMDTLRDKNYLEKVCGKKANAPWKIWILKNE